VPPDALEPPHSPITCTISATVSSASTTVNTVRHDRVRPRTKTSAASSAAPITHGHGDGGGWYTICPRATTASLPTRSGIWKLSTTCRVPGSRATSGGSAVPMKWARWSCQRAVVPFETRRHSGGADASALAGGLLVMVVVRFRYVAGERRFSKTPSGPTRR